MRFVGLRIMLTAGIALVVVVAPVNGVYGTESQRRALISERGKEIFRNTKNHCKSFQDLVTFAVVQTAKVPDLLEDLKLVLIGESLTKRGSGSLYIGNTPGARGDTGFKLELRDGSPQVEHAYAAMYIGKTMPPGSTEVAALLLEVMGPLTSGRALNAQDSLLYAIGGDIGQRLSASNYKELPGVIKRTMCA